MSTFTTSDGTQLHVTDRGEGPTLLLLSGWTFSQAVFARNVDELAVDHRVVAIDLRGHGRSSKEPRGWTLRQAALDVAEFLADRDLREVTVVAWSMGASVVHHLIEVAGPERLAGAVLIDMTPRMLADDGWQHAALGGLDAAAALGMARDFQLDREAVGGGLLPAFFGTPPDAETVTHFGTDHASCPTEALVSYLVSMGTDDFRDRIADFPVPALLIHGAQSQIYPTPVQDWLAEQLPEADVIVVEDAGHAVFWEQPAAFNAAVRGFVADACAGRTADRSAVSRA